MTEFLIERNGVRLFLHSVEQRGEGDLNFFRYVCEVSEAGLSATVAVFDMSPSSIPRLFKEMADKWRGWSGTLTAESLEGHLKLEAERDALGHIGLTVSLRSDPAWGFRVQTQIGLDLGDLDDLAARAAKFFV